MKEFISWSLSLSDESDDSRKRRKNVGGWSRMEAMFCLSIRDVFKENGSTSADIAKYTKTSLKCRALPR